MEKGETAQYKGKAFNDIDLNLEEDLMLNIDKDEHNIYYKGP